MTSSGPQKEKNPIMGGFPGVLFFFILAGGVLFFFPSLDLKVSGLFYDSGRGFFLKDLWVCTFIYRAVEIFTVGLTIALVLFLFIVRIRRKPLFSLNQKRVFYLVLVLAAGPGLSVNVVLKDHWGRARPYQVEAFGGKKAFTRAWVLSDQCENNCAFVSGHASMGFYLFAFSFLWPRHRKKWTALALASGCTVGLVRILQGSHFVSDVIFSGLVVYGVAYLLSRVMGLERLRHPQG
ncbi:MAG: phosphatase PAP2 family protein [Deltaproteobacteria bacterium]|nr:phosphatase PAP2 family protein [Deltaproteobacteria bacterium]